METAAALFQYLVHGADEDVSWVYRCLKPVVFATGATPVASASASVIWRACERRTGIATFTLCFL
jgi:hypothetical protein